MIDTTFFIFTVYHVSSLRVGALYCLGFRGCIDFQRALLSFSLVWIKIYPSLSYLLLLTYSFSIILHIICLCLSVCRCVYLSVYLSLCLCHCHTHENRNRARATRKNIAVISIRFPCDVFVSIYLSK